MGGPPALAIVIPCYNEEEVLPETHRRMVALIRELVGARKVSRTSTIYFVDDGSRDRTWSLIEQFAAEDSHIGGIKLSRNQGHQNSLLAGLFTAVGDAIVSIDADRLGYPRKVGRGERGLLLSPAQTKLPMRPTRRAIRSNPSAKFCQVDRVPSLATSGQGRKYRHDPRWLRRRTAGPRRHDQCDTLTGQDRLSGAERAGARSADNGCDFRRRSVGRRSGAALPWAPPPPAARTRP
jgi:hypothetical protein